MKNNEINRKIAVIFVADVVNFSKAMELDEDQTLKNFRFCRSILDNLFAEHGGRIFNTAGDSILAEFASAVSAAICASEFQKLVQERNSSSSLPENGKMEFRIGLNMGDVIVEGDNLYGDGVNVAARLEALSQPNGICLSKSIYDFVKNKTGFLFDDLGEQKVKNTSVHAFDILISSADRRNLSSKKEKEDNVSEESKPPFIAVLPFENMSGDVEQDYFADGITEDIISNLSSWKTFPVIARNSSFAFKKSELTASEFAKNLNVRYVVEGSVRKGGTKVRISSQLMDVSSETTIWSKKWDKSLDDIFEVQDEVSSSIASMVAPAIKGQEEVKFSTRKKINTTAWDFYLRARSLFNNNSSVPHEEIKKYCEKSISLQNDLSDTYVLYCRCLQTEIFDPDKAEKRKENETFFHNLAQKAFDLDPENPEAIMTLSQSFNIKRNYDRRLELAKKAVDCNPYHASAIHDYSRAILSFGKFRESLELTEKAIELSPIERPRFEGVFPELYLALREFNTSLTWLDLLIERSPKRPARYGYKASVLGHLGRIEEGNQMWKLYQEMRPYIRSIEDYKKVAPSWLKEVLVEGLKVIGVPNS